MHVVLHQPEIAGNTGSIMRLAANTGVRLHLVEPMGFELDEPRLRRAGLDYREWADVAVHADLDAALAEASGKVWALTRDGSVGHAEVSYGPDDALLFGPESTGLSEAVLGRDDLAGRVRIPMQPGSRSLNLANAVSVAVYEALRQHDFPGLT